MRNYLEKIDEATKSIRQKIGSLSPKIAIVLGSGLGEIAEEVKEKIVVSYDDIPNMPKSTVVGHEGNFVFGYLEDKPVMIMQGRIHFYEGYSLKEITFPIRVMKKLGVEVLVLTSAVGGIKGRLPLKVGDLVLVKDHINFMGDNPLVGEHYEEFGERFPDMSDVYNKQLRNIAKKVAKKLNIKLYEGVYVAVKGPSYETPSEIKMFKKLGANVVGMSIVPEAIVANQQKIKVLAIVYVSNLATGISKNPLSHYEVLKVAKKLINRFSKLIIGIVKEI